MIIIEFGRLVLTALVSGANLNPQHSYICTVYKQALNSS